MPWPHDEASDVGRTGAERHAHAQSRVDAVHQITQRAVEARRPRAPAPCRRTPPAATSVKRRVAIDCGDDGVVGLHLRHRLQRVDRAHFLAAHAGRSDSGSRSPATRTTSDTVGLRVVPSARAACRPAGSPACAARSAARRRRCRRWCASDCRARRPRGCAGRSDPRPATDASAIVLPMIATGGAPAPSRSREQAAAQQRNLHRREVIGPHGITVGLGSLRGIVERTALDGDARSIDASGQRQLRRTADAA